MRRENKRGEKGDDKRDEKRYENMSKDTYIGLRDFSHINQPMEGSPKANHKNAFTVHI